MLMDTHSHSETVGVFDNQSKLQNSVDELQSAGFDRASFSIMPPVDTVEKELGHRLGKVGDVLGDPDISRALPVSVRAVGTAQGVIVLLPLYIGALIAIGITASNGAGLGAVSLAAVIGGVIGGALGLVPAIKLKRRYTKRIDDKIDRGGLVLWVAVHNQEYADRAKKVMKSHQASDVQVHGRLAESAAA